MKDIDKYHTELNHLCDSIRKLVINREYDLCIDIISNAMKSYPHAPHPHNLMGIVLERLNDHSTAMKHFRAAWALDPTYIPARHNLDTYGTFHSRGKCAFDERDVVYDPEAELEIIYDENGIGRVSGKNKIEYNNLGIGRIIRR